MKIRVRPLSIKLFALAYVGQVAVSCVHNFYNAETFRLGLQATTLTQIDPAYIPAIFIARAFFALLWGLWLWFRASNPAKWIIIALFLPRLVQIGDAWVEIGLGRTNSFFWLAASALYLIAILLLFRPDARYWLATKGGTAKGNASVFE